MEDPGTLRKRAKKKLVSQKVVLALIDAAKSKGAQHRVQGYWNAYHCQERLYSHQGRFYGNYCKSRFCPICSGNRKAELIERYLPIVQTWEQPYFVTLTIKAVPAKSLSYHINGMVRAFRIISNRCKKRHQRGQGVKIMGIKSLECNFNPKRRTYNPHFHLIVSSKEVAELLVEEWLELWTTGYTYHKAQYAEEVRDGEKSLIEIIKYSSKTFTDPDPGQKKEKGRKVSPYVYASALDNIYAAFKGHRLFDRFGFNGAAKKVKEPGPARLVSDFKEWHYRQHLSDWIEKDGSSTLSGYKATHELMQLLSENVDWALQ